MRYLTDDLLQLERMKLSEYYLRMEAQSLKRADEAARDANLAIYIRKASDFNPKTKKYLVQEVKDLIDVDAFEKTIFDDSVLDEDVLNRLKKINKNLEEYQRLKGVETNG